MRGKYKKCLIASIVVIGVFSSIIFVRTRPSCEINLSMQGIPINDIINKVNMNLIIENIQKGNCENAIWIMKLISSDSNEYAECCEIIVANKLKLLDEFDEYYNNKEFRKALNGYEMLRDIEIDDNIIQKIIKCKDMLGLQGIWYDKYSEKNIVVIKDYSIQFEENVIELFETTYRGRFALRNEDNTIIVMLDTDNQIRIYTDDYGDDIYVSREKYDENKERKEKELNEKKKQEIKIEPYIGMTSIQVENSTWGKPKKINKTTYEWGTTEQWCYSNNRYIYLDNGIVTSIQETIE